MTGILIKFCGAAYSLRTQVGHIIGLNDDLDGALVKVDTFSLSLGAF